MQTKDQKTKKTIYDSRLWSDMNDIINAKDSDNIKESVIGVSVKLHTKDKDISKTTDNIYVTRLQIKRNYKRDIGDFIKIKIKVPIGYYMTKIYPHFMNMEMTLIIDPKEKTKNAKPIVERYKAAPILDDIAHIPNNMQASEVDMNQMGFTELTFQLLDKSVEGLRVKTIYGSFDRTITKDKSSATIAIDEFIRAAVAQEANNIIIDGKRSLDAIDIEKPDNVEKILRYTIPSGTRVIALPKYFQEKSMGIYNAGCSSYIQKFKDKKTFFVYSLYSYKKYRESKYKTIFYVPMSGSFSYQKNTYRYMNNTLYVLTDPNNHLNDLREVSLMSQGNGFRVSNAKSIMKKPVEITKEGPVFKRTNFVTEVAMSDRKDGINYAPVDKSESVNYNLFRKTSEVLQRAGTTIELKWRNSNPAHIYPGAPCKINTEDMYGNLVELYGIIHGIDTIYSTPDDLLGTTSAVTKRLFDTTSLVTVFITRNPIDQVNNLTL